MEYSLEFQPKCEITDPLIESTASLRSLAKKNELWPTVRCKLASSVFSFFFNNFSKKIIKIFSTLKKHCWQVYNKF